MIDLLYQRIKIHEHYIDAEVEHGDDDERSFYFVAECVRNIIIAYQRIAELTHTEAATTR